MKAYAGKVPPGLSRATLVAPLFALLLAIAVGLPAFERIDQARIQARESAFILETSEFSLKIEERFKAYRQVLRGARALLAASDEVNREEWRDYVAGLHLDADYGGIQGVGFAAYIHANRLTSHEKQVRAEGFPNYRVSPPGPRDEYSAILYIEPFNWRNQRAFGFDMLSEPVRREAMDRARTLGVPALSGKVRLVQETDTDIQAGVLLYLPVFRRDAALDTPEQHAQSFTGWVYSPFRLGDLIADTLGPPASRIRVYDGQGDDSAALLFDSEPDRLASDATLTRRMVLELDNRVWTLIFDSPPESAREREGVLLEKTAVVLIGFLFVLLTASLVATRQRALALDRIGASLRASEARYSNLVNLSQDGIAALDADLHFTFLNPSLIALLGYPDTELIGKRFDRLWPAGAPSRSGAVAARLKRGDASTYEQELLTADGEILTAIVTDAPHLDASGKLQGVILTITDISERKASEQRIHYLATHDHLTGLANRSSFLDRVNTAMLLALRHQTRFALLFLDLDHFKAINDTLGHAAGDILLIEAARRMHHALRASDLLARQGGDEFMILLHDVHSADEALRVADKIRRAVDNPFVLEGAEHHVAVSIGIALYPDDGRDVETLTRHADAAMYRAKQAGRTRSTGDEQDAPAADA